MTFCTVAISLGSNVDRENGAETAYLKQRRRTGDSSRCQWGDVRVTFDDGDRYRAVCELALLVGVELED